MTPIENKQRSVLSVLVLLAVPLSIAWPQQAASIVGAVIAGVIVALLDRQIR